MNLKILTRLGKLQFTFVVLALILSNSIICEEAPATPEEAKPPAEGGADTPADGAAMDTDDGKKADGAEAEAVPEPEPELCNTELVRSYGLQGRMKPSLHPMEMCPTVRRTCCRSKDQLSMYAAWKYGGQERLINDRFNHMERIYMKFLNVANKIRVRAQEVLEKNQKQKISNCNILADRIVKFEVEDIQHKIRSNLNNLKSFFEKSFKGFYCAVCNFDNHDFFDLEEKVLKVDDNFCYWTVSHSLSTLLFFYKDIISYSNIMSQFIMSCSNTGEYRFGMTIPPALVFIENEDISENLVRCNDNIESNKWLSHCRFICDKFSIVGLSGFFEPFLDKIELYGKWLKAVYSEKVIEETQPYDIRSMHKKKKSLSDLLVEGAGPVVADVKADLDKNTPNDMKDTKPTKEDLKEKKKEEEKKEEKKETKQSLRLLEEAKKEEPKKDEPKKDEAKKDEPKKEGDTGAPAEGSDGSEEPVAGGVIRKELVVFRNDLEGKFPLEDFVYEYCDYGVDFYTEGKNTLFEHELYMQVKALLHLGNIVKNKANMLNMFDKHFGRHFWNSIQTFSTFILLSAISLFMFKN